MGNQDAAADALVLDAIKNFAQDMFDKHRVQINNIGVQWLDASSFGEIDKRVRRVVVDQEKRFM